MKIPTYLNKELVMFSFYELPVNYTTEEGILQAIHVRAIDKGLDYNAPRNKMMYRDDFVSSQLNPTEWWEIKLIEIKPEYRRQGFGLNTLLCGLLAALIINGLLIFTYILINLNDVLVSFECALDDVKNDSGESDD